jgi:hypothetical protein
MIKDKVKFSCDALRIHFLRPIWGKLVILGCLSVISDKAQTPRSILANEASSVAYPMPYPFIVAAQSM